MSEPILDLMVAPDGRLVGTSASRLFASPVTGGNPTSIASAPAGQTFTGVTAFSTTIAALSSSPIGSTLIVVDGPSGQLTARPIALANATSIEHDPSLGALVVGDSSGGLHLVETSRFLVSPLATLGAPIASIARNSNRGDLAVATPRGIAWFAAGAPTSSLTVPPITALAYRAYDSTFTTYGQGCGNPAYAPSITASGSPFPGSLDFTVRLRHATPSAAAFLLLGLRPSSLRLDPIGLPGCTLWVSPLDAFPTRTTSLGTASTRLRIPPDPGLVGTSLHLQWTVQAPGANSLGLLLSQGGRATP